MRRLLTWPAACLCLAMLAWTTRPVVWASPIDSDPPATKATQAAATTEADEPEAVLEQALDHERQRNWTGAIEIYRKAVERWPSHAEFSRRLRLCELHFKLIRRYQDVSFRGVLLRLPREQAIDLYTEVLDRILTNYVDPVPLEPLVRHGLDNLEVALRDPLFLRANVGTAAPDRVNWLRDQLRKLGASFPCPIATPLCSLPSTHPSLPSRPSSCPRRPYCWSSPAAHATRSTTSPAI